MDRRPAFWAESFHPYRWLAPAPHSTRASSAASCSRSVGAKILATAGLSFLCLGTQPPSADWGSMLTTGRQFVILSSHVVLLPGLALFVIVLALNLVGDALRDLLNPRPYSRGELPRNRGPMRIQRWAFTPVDLHRNSTACAPCESRCAGPSSGFRRLTIYNHTSIIGHEGTAARHRPLAAPTLL
jgi:hypothetical protein